MRHGITQNGIRGNPPRRSECPDGRQENSRVVSALAYHSCHAKRRAPEIARWCLGSLQSEQDVAPSHLGHTPSTIGGDSVSEAEVPAYRDPGVLERKGGSIDGAVNCLAIQARVVINAYPQRLRCTKPSGQPAEDGYQRFRGFHAVILTAQRITDRCSRSQTNVTR